MYELNSAKFQDYFNFVKNIFFRKTFKWLYFDNQK